MSASAVDSVDARAELRSHWQLPAAWRLLSLLTRPLAYAPPAVDVFEDVLLNPADHAQTVANLHARLLGIGAGKSAEARWIGAVSRFARTFPSTFGPILGDATYASTTKLFGAVSAQVDQITSIESEADSSDETPTESAEASRKDGIAFDASCPQGEEVVEPEYSHIASPRVFRTFEEYKALSPLVRLLTLHAVAELVMCEHDTLLKTGSLEDIDLVELRLEPVGYDAVGSSYWYFGDECRLYREPDVRVMKYLEQKKVEEVKQAVERAAEEEAAQRKQKLAERRADRLNKRKEKWASHIVGTRITRASTARERASLQSQAGTPAIATPVAQRSGSLIASSDSKLLRSRTRRRARVGSFPKAEHSFDEVEAKRGTRRSLRLHASNISEDGKRQHGETASLNDRELTSSSLLAYPRKRFRFTSPEDSSDPTLRKCERWELLCSTPQELSAILERFGDVKNIKHPAERALTKQLTNVLLPLFQETYKQKIREQEKRIKAEWLMSHQKRSSRVSAMEQRRQKEEAEAAARAAEEAEEDHRREQRLLLVTSVTERLEKELTRELRLARRHITGENEAPADMPHKAPKLEDTRADRARRRTRGPSAGEIDIKSGNDVAHVNGLLSEFQRLPDDENEPRRVPPPTDSDTVKSETVEEEEPSVQLKLSVDGTSTSPSGDEPEGSRRASLSAATVEESVPSDLNWMILPGDQLPTRAITHFVFVHRSDFSNAMLEELLATSIDPDMSTKADISCFGVLLPSVRSEADPIIVEVVNPVEWVIEYGSEPRLWLKSSRAWYEMRDPHASFLDTFRSAQRKFEICVRLSILGHSLRGDQLSYESIVELLSMRYLHMRGYKQSDIEEETPFILEQMESLGKPSLLKSGFIRHLQKKQRDRKRQFQRKQQRQEHPRPRIAVDARELKPKIGLNQVAPMMEKPSEPEKKSTDVLPIDIPLQSPSTIPMPTTVASREAEAVAFPSPVQDAGRAVGSCRQDIAVQAPSSAKQGTSVIAPKYPSSLLADSSNSHRDQLGDPARRIDLNHDSHKKCELPVSGSTEYIASKHKPLSPDTDSQRAAAVSPSTLEKVTRAQIEARHVISSSGTDHKYSPYPCTSVRKTNQALPLRIEENSKILQSSLHGPSNQVVQISNSCPTKPVALKAMVYDRQKAAACALHPCNGQVGSSIVPDKKLNSDVFSPGGHAVNDARQKASQRGAFPNSKEPSLADRSCSDDNLVSEKAAYGSLAARLANGHS